jgi:hypothetical protein
LGKKGREEQIVRRAEDQMGVEKVRGRTARAGWWRRLLELNTRMVERIGWEVG